MSVMKLNYRTVFRSTGSDTVKGDLFYILPVEREIFATE